MITPKVFILDVDGVLTDGKMYYTLDGKFMKAFSVDDSEALKVLRDYIEIRIITGDKTGFNISKIRIGELNMTLDLVGVRDRIDWIEERYNPKEVIYMGDGIFDHLVFEEVIYAIAPAGYDYSNSPDYITRHKGGDRAVAEACLHIKERFFPDVT